MPRLVCLSDTHNCTDEIAVPDGDILIHAGDATINGTVAEISAFVRWFSGLPHKYKVFVAGNHDRLFETSNRIAREMLGTEIIYLQDSAAEIEGLKFYGSPWQPRFYDWAFNLQRGAQLAEKWSMISDDVEILITHGPPFGILDQVPRRDFIENTGCEDLLRRVHGLAAMNLKVHVFGHIHCGYGTSERFGVKFVNASNCDEMYEPVQNPIIIDL